MGSRGGAETLFLDFFKGKGMPGSITGFIGRNGIQIRHLSLSLCVSLSLCLPKDLATFEKGNCLVAKWTDLYKTVEQSTVHYDNCNRDYVKQNMTL